MGRALLGLVDQACPVQGLAAPLIARLAEAEETLFIDQAAWQAHLNRLGIVPPAKTGLAVIQDPAQIATEGAQWGSIHAHGFLPDAVVLSDDAGQFDIGKHALCWVHAERLAHKLDTFTDLHRSAQQRMRKLKLYQVNPGNNRRLALRARFDRIFRRRTGFVTLDRLLARLHANKAELLMVLQRPEIPLHTNGSENDIRCQLAPPRHVQPGVPPARSLAVSGVLPAFHGRIFRAMSGCCGDR
jgi:hypothetical protein